MILYKPWVTLLCMCQIVRSRPQFTPKSQISDFDYYYEYESEYSYTDNYTDYYTDDYTDYNKERSTKIPDSFTQCLRDLENVDLEFIEPDTLKNVDVDDVAPRLGLTFFSCLTPTPISPVNAPEISPIYSYGKGFQGDIMFRSKEEYCRIVSPPPILHSHKPPPVCKCNTTSTTTGRILQRHKRQIPDNTILPKKWPNKVIPLRFAKNIAEDREHMDVIIMAIKEIESKTCLKFLEDPDKLYETYVHIIKLPETDKDAGCWTYVGYRPGRSQKLNLSPGCFTIGTVVHELMHAAGFYHTHARRDRDQYVDIHEENIEVDNKNQIVNFTDSTMMDLNIPYDFTSAMHYYWYAFQTDRAKDNNWATITKKGDNPRQPKDKIHDQRKTGLSELDVEGLRKLYECEPILGTTCASLNCPNQNESCDDGDGRRPATCECKTGYQREGDQCKATCVPLNCPNPNESCVDGDGRRPATCECKTGYQREGDQCKVTTCASLNCPNPNESCDDGDGSRPATCECKTGYQRDGDQCKVTTCPSLNCLDPNESCVDGDGRRPATCELTTCASLNNCPNPNESCGDGDGSRPATCECKTGYRREGDQCKVTTCASLNCPNPNENCDDGDGSRPATCECKTGYQREGDQCKVTTCASLNNCPNPNESCDDGDGRRPATCECKTGYRREGDQCKVTTCASLNCPNPNEKCDDGDGRRPATCECKTGYRREGDQCKATCSALNCKQTEMCVEGYGTKSATCVCKPDTGDFLGSYLPPRNC